MSTAPQPRDRASARIGPVSLNNRLDQPTLSGGTGTRTVKQQPPGEKPIVQTLGSDAPEYTLKGTCYLKHANALDLLTLGGPIDIRHDRPDAPPWAFVETVNTAPFRYRPAEGQWGYTYTIDVRGVPAPDNERPTNPLPDAANILPSYGPPEPRGRRTAEIAGITFPPNLRHPEVTVESTANLKTHDVLGQRSIVQYRGREDHHITIKGSCQRRHTAQLKSLDRGEQIDIRTDRFVGPATVDGIDISDQKLRYAPGQWGQTYTLELTHIRGASD